MGRLRIEMEAKFCVQLLRMGAAFIVTITTHRPCCIASTDGIEIKRRVDHPDVQGVLIQHLLFSAFATTAAAVIVARTTTKTSFCVLVLLRPGVAKCTPVLARALRPRWLRLGYGERFSRVDRRSARNHEELVGNRVPD